MSMEELVTVTRVYRGRRTQIPVEIARFLELEEGNKVAWFMSKNGRVYLKKATSLPKKGGKYVVQP